MAAKIVFSNVGSHQVTLTGDIKHFIFNDDPSGIGRILMLLHLIHRHLPNGLLRGKACHDPVSAVDVHLCEQVNQSAFFIFLAGQNVRCF